MKAYLIDPKSYQTSQWTGGQTTELLISPEGSSYLRRDFNFRISNAIVAIPQSEFTALPGVTRKLMLLDGALKIEHEKQHTVQLFPFEVDCFSGDWKSKATGVCEDFNVMTRGDFESSLFSQTMANNEQLEFDIEAAHVCFVVFVYHGEIEIELENQAQTVVQKGLLFVQSKVDKALKLKAKCDSILVMVRVWSKAQY